MIRLTSRFSSRDIPEEFKGDAQVTAEVEVLNHMDDVKLVVLVFAAKGVQKFHLNQRLVVKSVQPARQHQQAQKQNTSSQAHSGPQLADRYVTLLAGDTLSITQVQILT